MNSLLLLLCFIFSVPLLSDQVTAPDVALSSALLDDDETAPTEPDDTPADPSDAAEQTAADADDADISALTTTDDAAGDDDVAGLDDLLADPTEDDSEDDTSDDESDSDDDTTADEGQGSYSLTDGAEVTLPLIGPLTFGPSPQSVKNNTATPTGTTRATTAADKKQFTIGPVTLTDIVGHVTETGHLDVTGTFTLQKSNATVSIKKYDDAAKKLVILLTCKDSFDCFVLPEKKASISELMFTLTPDGPTLTAKKSIFTSDKNESTLNFGIDPLKDTTARAKVTTPVPLTTISSDAKGNAELEKVMLKDISISFVNPLFPPPPASLIDAVAPATTVTCTALLSPIVLYGNAHLSDSDATIILSTTSLAFSSYGQTPIQLQDDIVLDSPLLEFEKMQGQALPDLTIGGTLQCTLPVVGAINTPVRGTKRFDGMDLSGKLGNTVDFGPVSFKDPEIVINSQKAMGDADPSAGTGKPAGTLSVSIQSTFDLFGLKVAPKLAFMRPEGGVNIGGKQLTRIVKFSAEINDGQPIKPLESIPGLKEIPGVADFIVNKAQLGVDSTKNTFIGGVTNIMNIETQAKIITSGGRGLMFSSLKAWKPSDSIPSLAGTVFDSIAFEAINFGYTAKQYLDNDTGMMIQKGANIFGTVDMTQGIFDPLRKFLGDALPKKLIASLILNPNPMLCKLQVAIPIDVKLSSRVSLHQIIFEVGGGPDIALMLSLKFMTGSNDPPLIFTARIEFDIAFFAVSGSLEGTWKKPFGIPGLEISNVAIEIQQPYGPLPPVGFGITGSIALGDFLAMVAVKISPTSIMLIAEISKWPLFCLPSLLRVIGLDLGPLDVLKAIDIALYDVKFKFAPVGGQIGTIYFDPGISASGTMILNIPSIINAKLEAGFNLGLTNGFKLYAQMPKFNIGPLRITGKGKDMEWNTPDDGPIFSMEFSLARQRIFVSALAELFGSSSEIEIDIGLLHMRFKMILKLLGLLDAHIAGETYHKGYRIGFKTIGTAKLGPNTELTLTGDINTLGCSFAGVLKSLTLKDIADICHIPSGAIPSIGLEDVEFYIRAQG